jgi:hypothetical protein
MDRLGYWWFQAGPEGRHIWATTDAHQTQLHQFANWRITEIGMIGPLVGEHFWGFGLFGFNNYHLNRLL